MHFTELKTDPITIEDFFTLRLSFSHPLQVEDSLLARDRLLINIVDKFIFQDVVLEIWESFRQNFEVAWLIKVVSPVFLVLLLSHEHFILLMTQEFPSSLVLTHINLILWHILLIREFLPPILHFERVVHLKGIFSFDRPCHQIILYNLVLLVFVLQTVHDDFVVLAVRGFESLFEVGLPLWVKLTRQHFQHFFRVLIGGMSLHSALLFVTDASLPFFELSFCSTELATLVVFENLTFK